MYNGEVLSAANRAQLHGVLAKKHTAGQSGNAHKWAKR